MKEIKDYGKWDKLVLNESIELPAHDGDFFPIGVSPYLDALKIILKADNEELNAPLQIDLDLTQSCNHKCIVCYSMAYRKTQLYRNAKFELSFLSEFLKSLYDRGLLCLRFTGGGEPLMHPNFTEVLKLTKDIGLTNAVLTNGDLLSEDNKKEISLNCNHLRISIDAATTETRKKLHGRSSKPIDQLFDTLKSYNNFRNKESMIISITYLIHELNINEIKKATEKIREIGLDSISFRPIYGNYKNAYDYKILASELSDAKDLETNNFKVYIPKRKPSESDNLNPNDYFNKCLSSLFRTIIEPTNKGPTFNLCGLHRGKYNPKIGTFTNSREFLEKWNGEYFSNLRNSCPSICKKCIDVSMNISLNKLLQQLIKNPDSNIIKKII